MSSKTKLEIGDWVKATDDYADDHDWCNWVLGQVGKIVDIGDWCLLVEFPDYKGDKGHAGNKEAGAKNRWWFFEEDLIKVAAPKTRPAEKKASKGKQEYKGNGKHTWERVAESTLRLRVPGGWIYDTTASSVFVPFPEKVAETAGYVL